MQIAFFICIFQCPSAHRHWSADAAIAFCKHQRCWAHAVCDCAWRSLSDPSSDKYLAMNSPLLILDALQKLFSPLGWRCVVLHLDIIGTLSMCSAGLVSASTGDWILHTGVAHDHSVTLLKSLRPLLLGCCCCAGMRALLTLPAGGSFRCRACVQARECFEYLQLTQALDAEPVRRYGSVWVLPAGRGFRCRACVGHQQWYCPWRQHPSSPYLAPCPSRSSHLKHFGRINKYIKFDITW